MTKVKADLEMKMMKWGTTMMAWRRMTGSWGDGQTSEDVEDGVKDDEGDRLFGRGIRCQDKDDGDGLRCMLEVRKWKLFLLNWNGVDSCRHSPETLLFQCSGFLPSTGGISMKVTTEFPVIAGEIKVEGPSTISFNYLLVTHLRITPACIAVNTDRESFVEAERKAESRPSGKLCRGRAESCVEAEREALSRPSGKLCRGRAGSFVEAERDAVSRPSGKLCRGRASDRIYCMPTSDRFVPTSGRSSDQGSNRSEKRSGLLRLRVLGADEVSIVMATGAYGWRLGEGIRIVTGNVVEVLKVEILVGINSGSEVGWWKLLVVMSGALSGRVGEGKELDERQRMENDQDEQSMNQE
ncbi:hypothetical protein LR48_Vigan393s001800 [Vigna angularis]|uniref:Uncharacterized protein n=1 Tax=Phaseolus angularis TaxID=3914 RepID=A0A0L9TAD0_PHAAN|nr:hypothetical protein LR48_Vigan393s001800 [Vigna angularis]